MKLTVQIASFLVDVEDVFPGKKMKVTEDGRILGLEGESSWTGSSFVQKESPADVWRKLENRAQEARAELFRRLSTQGIEAEGLTI